MIHYDELIKAEKMGYFSDYETLLFARAKGKIKSITGVLPLTFTAKGGNAVDWVIYGNDDNGTENLFDGTYSETGEEILVDGSISGNPNWSITQYIEIESESAYTVCNGLAVAMGTAFAFYDSEKNVITGIPYHNQINVTATAPSNAKYLRASVLTNPSQEKYNADVFMIVKGSTAPDHYIPYQQGVGEQRVDGYYVPLTISQAGQPDKTVDIYIGDTPLTEGETVSKTSTGQDIELFSGENTVDTSLYNKPEMKIDYK